MLEMIFGRKKQITPQEINSVIPKEFNLYDISEIQLTNIEIDKITTEALNNYFRKSISAIFTLNGEINGHAIAQLDSKYEFEAEELGIKDMFVEGTNIILGHILNHIEDDHELISHLSAPLVINDKSKGANEHMKKMRILSILNKSLSEKEFYQLDYTMHFNGDQIPFHIFLMININDTKVGN